MIQLYLFYLKFDLLIDLQIKVNASVNKIVHNHGTFYLYYKDIYDIFNQIEKELLDATMQILNTAIESEQLDFSKHMSMIMELAKKYSSYVSVLLTRQNNN